MNSWLRLSIALCAIVLAHSGLGQNYQGRELVKATLLADTSAIVPGKPEESELVELRADRALEFAEVVRKLRQREERCGDDDERDD